MHYSNRDRERARLNFWFWSAPTPRVIEVATTLIGELEDLVLSHLLGSISTTTHNTQIFFTRSLTTDRLCDVGATTIPDDCSTTFDMTSVEHEANPGNFYDVQCVCRP